MKKFAKCQQCGAVHSVDEMIKTTLAKRGGASAYMCLQCGKRNLHYHASNDKNRGTQKQNGVFVGIELETSYTTEKARNELFSYGMIPTHDCSLESDEDSWRYGEDGSTCEYVTGILSGLNIASKLCNSIEALMNNNDLNINDSCGTHFHVSIDSMKDQNGDAVYMGYIQRFYHSLFIPLCEKMKANPQVTEALFGRYFDEHYCVAINERSYTGNRYLFINVTNNSNIEFRLNKFINAKQYQNLMKMETEMVQAIVTNFCEHFNDEKIDARRYPNMTAYRKHKASVTAQKLIKIFEKYTNN